MRLTGKVKWFNDAKGFGFITSDLGGTDLFVHFASIQMKGRKTLIDGARVEFDEVERPKGRSAEGVVVLDKWADTTPYAHVKEQS